MQVLVIVVIKYVVFGFLEYEVFISGCLDIIFLDDMFMGEDDEGMIVNNVVGKEMKKSESKGVEVNLLCYKICFFVVEYVFCYC